MADDGTTSTDEPQVVEHTSLCVCYRNGLKIYNPDCDVHYPQLVKKPNVKAGKRAWKNYWKNR